MHLCLFLSTLRIMHAYVKCWGDDSAFVEAPVKGIIKFASSKCYNSSSCHASSIGANSSLKVTNEFLYSLDCFRVVERKAFHNI